VNPVSRVAGNAAGLRTRSSATCDRAGFKLRGVDRRHRRALFGSRRRRSARPVLVQLGRRSCRRPAPTRNAGEAIPGRGRFSYPRVNEAPRPAQDRGVVAERAYSRTRPVKRRTRTHLYGRRTQASGRHRGSGWPVARPRATNATRHAAASLVACPAVAAPCRRFACTSSRVRNRGVSFRCRRSGARALDGDIGLRRWVRDSPAVRRR